MSITMIVAAALAALASAAVLLRSSTASAHCDTEDGPAATDGRRALETGNINHALRWIGPEGGDELRTAFYRALAARRRDDHAAPAEQPAALAATATAEQPAALAAAATAAESAFLQALVRIHRAGEGAGFDGIKPRGTPVDPVVAAADAALASGSMDELSTLVPADRLPRLRELFAEALARRDFHVDDVAAGRRWVAAYAAFVKYAEGEEHAHGNRHAHHHHAAA